MNMLSSAWASVVSFVLTPSHVKERRREEVARKENEEERKEEFIQDALTAACCRGC